MKYELYNVLCNSYSLLWTDWIIKIQKIQHLEKKLLRCFFFKCVHCKRVCPEPVGCGITIWCILWGWRDITAPLRRFVTKTNIQIFLLLLVGGEGDAQREVCEESGSSDPVTKHLSNQVLILSGGLSSGSIAKDLNLTAKVWRNVHLKLKTKFLICK